MAQQPPANQAPAAPTVGGIRKVFTKSGRRPTMGSRITIMAFLSVDFPAGPAGGKLAIA